MPQKNNAQGTFDRTSPDLGKRIFDEIEDYSRHDGFRNKVKEIFEECTGTTTFKEKIKNYAGESFNDRLFRNGWAIMIFLASLIVAGIVGRLI